MATNKNMYVISLDAIDLNFLPTTFKTQYGKQMPLWAMSNLDRRNQEYYEFEIQSSETENNEDFIDESNQEKTYTTCHICDIEVPTLFLKEHFDSFKHKINVKIVNTALDRLKKSINVDKCESNKKPNVHFCPVCVTVINNEEKQAHERSMLHKNSVIVEKFLHDFYLLYANENDEISNNMEKVNVTCENIVKVENNNNIIPESQLEKNAIKHDTDQNYCNEKLNGVHEEFHVSVKTDDTEVKDEVKKKKNKKANDVKKEEDIKFTHSVETDVKTANAIESKSDTAQKEITTKKSKKKKKEAQEKEIKADVNRSIEPELLSDECDIYFDLSDLSTLEDETHHHLVKSLYYVYCKVCKINVKEEKTHISSGSHQQNYLGFLAENCLFQANHLKIECMVCRCVIHYDHEIIHCDDITHISNLELFNKKILTNKK